MKEKFHRIRPPLENHLPQTTKIGRCIKVPIPFLIMGLFKNIEFNGCESLISIKVNIKKLKEII